MREGGSPPPPPPPPKKSEMKWHACITFSLLFLYIGGLIRPPFQCKSAGVVINSFSALSTARFAIIAIALVHVMLNN